MSMNTNTNCRKNKSLDNGFTKYQFWNGRRIISKPHSDKDIIDLQKIIKGSVKNIFLENFLK